MPLSDIQIRNLKPEDKPFKAHDADGLFLKVTPIGSKLWRFRYRVEGREKLIGLGKYPVVTLKDARAKAFVAKKKLDQGIDPSQERKDQKADRLAATTNNFAAIADELVEKVRKEGKSVVTVRKLASFMELAKPSIGKMPITDIKAPDLLKVLKQIEEAEKYETPIASKPQSAASLNWPLRRAGGIRSNLRSPKCAYHQTGHASRRHH